MKILIDARPFVDPHAGGVTKFALGVVEALMKAMPDAAFTLVTTGLRHTQYTIPNTRYSSRHVLIPNKLWSFLSMIGVVSLDRVVKDKPDLLFLPNLGFTGRPHTPYFLLVHDLSFLIEPRWFRLRGRLWHRAVQAKRLIREARHLFAVSERTKQDLIEQLKIPADNITVIPIGLDPVKTFDELPLPLQGKRFVLAMGHGNTRKNSTCAQVAVEALRRDPKFSDV
ncbi:hypothetical protein EXS71_04280, partial [Candidatus Uhrbacteria bacterium]|nr:hypothetical protein [Candidatus Uhrbacteria bacterium]